MSLIKCLTTLLLFLVLASASAESFHTRLILAAKEQTLKPVTYDGSYVRIAYPNGDVPADRGVCTDVLIRAYRRVGIDLQSEVHEDMKAAFDAYPRRWGLSRPDSNIDHRGIAFAVSEKSDDYRPGDIVTWMLPGNLPHIGLVTDERSPDGSRPLIVHNIGRGPGTEDMLFDYVITGHYRYPQAVSD
jgi:uncharacterized protein